MAASDDSIPSQGTLLAMPPVVINMGGEMVYILEQRLQAQNISAEKAARVLRDVIRSMYAPEFIKELFKPQHMYSNESTRQIFEKIAHSSIMRLNKTSMDKLYDLMSMGFKYQLLSISAPEELVVVTKRHLSYLQRIVKGTSAAPLVARAATNLDTTYADLPIGEWFLMKQMLASFLQNRRVRVSILLKAKMQHKDGRLGICYTGPVPRGSEPPGRVSYLLKGTSNTVHLPAGEGSEAHDGYRNNTCYAPGANLYNKANLTAFHRAMAKKGGVSEDQSTSAEPKSEDGAEERSNFELDPRAVKQTDEEKKESAMEELNLLATLIGAPAKETNTDRQSTSHSEAQGTNQIFSLNLFSEPAEEFKVPTITVDGRAERKDLNSMLDDLDFKDASLSKAEGKYEDEDDLLDLMDSAAMK